MANKNGSLEAHWKRQFVQWAKSLTDEQLESEYYKLVIESLGSQTEEMYELGYDIQDIIEQENYERILIKKTEILESICELRGIKLWEPWETPYENSKQ